MSSASIPSRSIRWRIRIFSSFVGVTTLGYFMGEIEFVKRNLEIAALMIVAVSLLPMVIEVVRHRREAKALAADAAAEVAAELSHD